MKLATLDNDTRDGRLVVVSKDLKRAVSVESIAPTLQQALDCWDQVEPKLRSLATALEEGRAADAFPFDPAKALAPLPRAFQWLDGSVFRNHLELMGKAFNTDPDIHLNAPYPMMYQGGSDCLIGAQRDIRLPSEDDGIDFEAEVGVIISDVPMGTKAAEAADAIKLLVLINDVSLRNLAPREFKGGFGWLHSKPSSSFSPVAVTPDELGSAWRDGRVHLPLHIRWNEATFGSPDAGEMSYSFFDLLENAARTRDLSAGTIIGSGTVSNREYAKVGSACIAERRAIEIIAEGKPKTSYMHFGDRVRIEMTDGLQASVFGAIDQQVVQYRRSQHR